MDWNRIEGNWKQFKGQAKEKWGRLTDNDLDIINGHCMSSEHFGQLAWQFKRMSGSSGLKVQAAIAC